MTGEGNERAYASRAGSSIGGASPFSPLRSTIHRLPSSGSAIAIRLADGWSITAAAFHPGSVAPVRRYIWEA